jgi:hypothetical protein
VTLHVFEISAFAVGAWGIVVAIFAPRFNRSRFVQATNRGNWWIGATWRTRLLGVLIGVMGFTIGVLGITGVIEPGW